MLGQEPEQEQALLPLIERLQTIDAPDLQGALDAAAQFVAEAFRADKVDTFLYEDATATLVSVGTSDTPMGRRQKALGMDRLPLANGGRAVEIFRTGASFRDGRVDQDPHELVGIREGLGVRSTIGVPFTVAGKCRGVLLATSATPEFFAADDLRFLEVTARWVGLLAERAEQRREGAAAERITVLAHDLKNLLAPLQGRLDLIIRRARREGHERYLRDAEAATVALDRLRGLVTNLLDVRRLDEGLFTVDTRPTDLVGLAQEVATAARSGDSPITVQAPEEVIVCVDPDRVRQALENVIGNAVKHTTAGTAVEVTVTAENRETGRWAIVTVTDQGPGVPLALRDHIFERFTAGPRSSGLGLGLYLARGFIKAHGGTLAVTDAPGGGARFTIALPITDDTAEVAGG